MFSSVTMGTRLCGLAMGFLLLFSFSNPLSASEIYKCKNAQGGIAFQDSPCGGASQSEKISVLSQPATPPATAVTLPPVETSVRQSARDTKGGVNERAEESGGSFAWRVSRGKEQGYLMGSIHFGKADMYPLPAPLMAAFERSDALVVEANIVDADQMAMAQLVLTKGSYTDGTTLSQVLDRKTWERLGVVAAGLGVPVAMLEGQRPWLVSMTLTTMALKKMGLNEELGIDRYFLKQAKQAGKEIRELESVEEQLTMLSGFSPAVEEAMLLQTLEDIDQADEYFEKLFSAWQGGNPQVMDALFMKDANKSAASGELMRVLVDERNVTMSKGIVKMMRAGCHCFVVVGAGHLGGEQGIVKMLQQKGYRVEQL